MNIQWFPGHMAKTRKLISENLKLVDIVIVLLDARIPYSSKNPELESIIGNKLSIYVMNKSDLSDPKVNDLWQEHFKKHKKNCVFVDSNKGKGFKELLLSLRNLTKPIIDREKARGKVFRPIRTMVVGIPNVGKSSFINRISGKSIAKTGDKPGVTRNKQWVRLRREIELLDTPGILWPKFDDNDVALNLAFTGAIKDEIMDTPELASRLVVKLAELYPDMLESRYKLRLNELLKEETNPEILGHKILTQCGINRGCIVRSNEVDYYRISSILLDEFRGSKIGKISLEKPEDIK